MYFSWTGLYLSHWIESSFLYYNLWSWRMIYPELTVIGTNCEFILWLIYRLSFSSFIENLMWTCFIGKLTASRSWLEVNKEIRIHGIFYVVSSLEYQSIRCPIISSRYGPYQEDFNIIVSDSLKWKPKDLNTCLEKDVSKIKVKSEVRIT